MIELKPCPFCGGEGKISQRNVVHGGLDNNGDSHKKIRLQVICKRCYARSRPVTTDWLKNYSVWERPYAEMQKMIEPYEEKCRAYWDERCDNEAQQTFKNVR